MSSVLELVAWPSMADWGKVEGTARHAELIDVLLKTFRQLPELELHSFLTPGLSSILYDLDFPKPVKKCIQSISVSCEALGVTFDFSTWWELWNHYIISGKGDGMKHSKLQLQVLLEIMLNWFILRNYQVLSLYKECMRAAQLKPGFEQTVRTEFKRNAALPRYFSFKSN